MNDRKQATAYRGTLSSKEEINIGVPQGSILGPLLFSIFVNDLPTHLTCKSVLYADDTALMFSSNDSNELAVNLNSNLKKVNDWLQMNELSLNISKTKYMVCGTSQRIHKFDDVSLSVGENEIERVDTFKYLGVWFDPIFKWDHHIQNSSKIISQRIGLVSRLRKFIPFKIAKLLANSLVMPYFDYCDLVWNNCSKDLCEKLQILQNRLARVVLKEGRRAHITDMLNAMKWKNLETRSNINLIHLVRKCLLNEAPNYLTEKFAYVYSRHNYPTNSSNNLNLLQDNVRTQAGKRTFHYRGADAWNDIPHDVKVLPYNSKRFKKALYKMI